MNNYIEKESQENNWVLSIEQDMLRFSFVKEKSMEKEIVLNTGYQFVSETFFKHEIPTEIEIEYAINYIEDELMSNRELINQEKKLVCADTILIELFRKNNELKNKYSRREFEDVFSKYASISMGEPLSRRNMLVTREDFALILILREIMHHLNYEDFEFTKESLV